MTKKSWRSSRPHEPTVRPTEGGKSVLVDDLDEFAGAVIGAPPADFSELIERARKLAQAAGNLVYDKSEPEEQTQAQNEHIRDVLLLAAYSISQGVLNDGKGESPHAFVVRAKQVVKWCQRPLQLAGPLEERENKAQEIARQIARRLFPGEGFLAIIFHENIGHVTWVSSAARRDWIPLLENTLANIKADQAKRS